MNPIKDLNRADYFPGLTGVRAIAAYMVYFHHFNPFAGTEHKRLLYFFTELNVGVTLFFVLSGFLIAYRYYSFETLDFRQYIVNRLARIYPMYILLTVATFLYFYYVAPTPAGETLKIFLLNITFLKGYFEELKFTGVSQGWSLTVEETFYLLAPLIFLLIKRKHFFIIVLPFVFVTIGFIIVSLFEGHTPYGFMISDQFMLRYTFLGRSTEFFTGIALALFFMKNKDSYNTRYFTYTGIFFILLLIFILSFLWEGYFGSARPAGMFINSVLLPVFGFAPLFWGLMKEQNPITKVLSSNLFVTLGKSSYIFYLIHLGIVYDFFYGFTHNSFVLFIVLNLASIVLFKFVEEPLNNFIRKRYKILAEKKLVVQ